VTDRSAWPWNAAPEDCDDYDAAVWHATTPPQTLEEWVQGQRASRALDRTLPKHRATPGQFELVSLDAFDMRNVEWIDKPFLQRSAFHLLAGRKGTCKGTYLAGLCARVSIGAMGPKRRVIVVTSEDSIEFDFKPRVVAAGGNPSVCDIARGEFRMPRDIAALKAMAESRGDVGLIVIDPIGNHLGGSDTDQEGSVRDAIAPLNDLADDMDCMVFGVRHLTKSATNGALASVLGSTAWVDVPRCVILMAADDEDEMTFHYQVIAGNRGPKGAARVLKLSIVDVPVEGDEPIQDITLAVEAGSSEKDVEELLANQATKGERSKSEAARLLILSILEDEGEQESDTLDARVVAETGLAVKTVKNVRTGLKDAGLIRIFPVRTADGKGVDLWMVKRSNAPRLDPGPRKS
jgi:hypothetical protein